MQSVQSLFLYGMLSAIATLAIGFVLILSLPFGSNIGNYLFATYLILIGLLLIYLIWKVENMMDDIKTFVASITKKPPPVALKPKPIINTPVAPPAPQQATGPSDQPYEQHEPYYYSETNVEYMPPWMY
jgi:hypothetical protein